MFELFDRTIKKSDPNRGFSQRRLVSAVLLVSISVAASANAATTSHRNAKSGLLTWTNTQDGFSLSLQQLTPDNVRAIYEGMGASPANVDRIANYCVFGTDARNNAGSAITYDVATWRAVTRNHIRHRLRSKRGCSASGARSVLITDFQSFLQSRRFSQVIGVKVSPRSNSNPAHALT